MKAEQERENPATDNSTESQANDDSISKVENTLKNDESIKKDEASKQTNADPYNTDKSIEVDVNVDHNISPAEDMNKKDFDITADNNENSKDEPDGKSSNPDAIETDLDTDASSLQVSLTKIIFLSLMLKEEKNA